MSLKSLGIHFLCVTEQQSNVKIRGRYFQSTLRPYNNLHRKSNEISLDISIKTLIRAQRGGLKVGVSFLAEELMSVDDIDFDFENSPIRVVLTSRDP